MATTFTSCPRPVFAAHIRSLSSLHPVLMPSKQKMDPCKALQQQDCGAGLRKLFSFGLQGMCQGKCAHREGHISSGVPNLPIAAQPMRVIGALRRRLHRRRQRVSVAARQVLGGRQRRRRRQLPRSRRLGCLGKARQQRAARGLPRPAVRESAPQRVITEEQVIAAGRHNMT